MSRTRDLIYLIDLRISEILDARRGSEPTSQEATAVRLFCDARGLLIEQLGRGAHTWGDEVPGFEWEKEMDDGR